MLNSRKILQLSSWPDPLLQERLEDMGFFFDPRFRSWIRYCDDEEVASISEWLKRHHLRSLSTMARGRGETSRLPKLSDELLRKDGGTPSACALCGAQNVFCRQWIEGDDTDSTEYPGAAKFFLCGQCVQTRMHAHPRLYAPTEDHL